MDKRYRGIAPADRAVRKGITKALERIGADLTGKAQREAPKDTGALRASADWNIEGGAAMGIGSFGAQTSTISVRVSFNTPYARRQHEETGYSHSSGRAKYLAEPLRQNTGSYRNEIRRSVKEELRRMF